MIGTCPLHEYVSAKEWILLVLFFSNKRLYGLCPTWHTQVDDLLRNTDSVLLWNMGLWDASEQVWTNHSGSFLAIQSKLLASTDVVNFFLWTANSGVKRERPKSTSGFVRFLFFGLNVVSSMDFSVV
jgi:hypothetical protein